MGVGVEGWDEWSVLGCFYVRHFVLQVLYLSAIQTKCD